MERLADYGADSEVASAAAAAAVTSAAETAALVSDRRGLGEADIKDYRSLNALQIL